MNIFRDINQKLAFSQVIVKKSLTKKKDRLPGQKSPVLFEFFEKKYFQIWFFHKRRLKKAFFLGAWKQLASDIK